MRFLGLGKKKSKTDASNALETLPNTPLSAKTPSLTPDIPAPEPVAINSISKTENLATIPVPEIDSLNDSSLETNNIPTENLAEDQIIPKPDNVLNLSENSDESSFDALPNFSEDDFSAPPPLSSISNELTTPKKEVKKEVLDDRTSLFSSAKKEEKSNIFSFTSSSYADSKGVYVARTAYISLLNSLKESSQNVTSLSTRQKHLIDFDNSMKKLFEKESADFEKLHKNILAILPFISKK